MVHVHAPAADSYRTDFLLLSGLLVAIWFTHSTHFISALTAVRCTRWKRCALRHGQLIGQYGEFGKVSAKPANVPSGDSNRNYAAGPRQPDSLSRTGLGRPVQ